MHALSDKIKELRCKIEDIDADNRNLRSQLVEKDTSFRKIKQELDDENNNLHSLLIKSKMLIEKQDEKIHALVAKSIKKNL
jgi:hypothetical protein